MRRVRIVGVVGVTVALSATFGCDSRGEAMRRQVQDETKTVERAELPEAGPSHPIRDELEPVLSKIYKLNQVPRIVEADIDLEGEDKYQLDAGVAAVVRIPAGLSQEQRVRAVVKAVAEADAWAFRKNARRDYADLIHRVKRGYGDDQKEAILKAYADLRLLQFFNSEEAAAAINALPGELKPIVAQMQAEYVSKKEAVWEQWMAVKMYARRVVAGDEPFRSVLRQIKKELGKEEPPPRTWEDSMDAPFKGWAQQIRNNEDLLTRITNMKELREREEYLGDTHSIWAVEGSPMLPPEAKGLRPEKDLGFAVRREDLGGGYNDLTFVFSKNLKGAALKKAFLRSIIYAHLLHDFQMLATAGSDFAKRDADNVIDATTAVVPDKYDPLYAKCGSGAAVETLIAHFKGKYPILADLSGIKNPEKALEIAHKCVIEGARGEIHTPARDDDKDVEGPAPGSRLAFYQMLARFENIDVDLAAMGTDKRTAEDDVIDEAEAALKRIKAGSEPADG